MKTAWDRLPESLSGTSVSPWAIKLRDLAQKAANECNHGDLPGWSQALQALPALEPRSNLRQGEPCLGRPVEDPERLRGHLMKLHPWRKGPLSLGGVSINTEWRSDWKWSRVEPHIDLKGHAVLDIGCGNGYFGLRMLGAGARSVVGVDPTWVFIMQWLAQQHFAPALNNFVIPARDSDLPEGLSGFDSVFSMGVLYHRKNAAQHLHDLKAWLKPGGRLVLETLIIDQPGKSVLAPEGRYARMPNVWYLPTPATLLDELKLAGFGEVEMVDITTTTIKEQRSTDWMTFESLSQCLDPQNQNLTIEGHPAPVRAVVIARR